MVQKASLHWEFACRGFNCRGFSKFYHLLIVDCCYANRSKCCYFLVHSIEIISICSEVQSNFKKHFVEKYISNIFWLIMESWGKGLSILCTLHSSHWLVSNIMLKSSKSQASWKMGWLAVFWVGMDVWIRHYRRYHTDWSVLSKSILVHPMYVS